jgi:hypothetical protein
VGLWCLSLAQEGERASGDRAAPFLNRCGGEAEEGVGGVWAVKAATLQHEVGEGPGRQLPDRGARGLAGGAENKGG